MRRIALLLVVAGCHASGEQGSGKPAHEARTVGAFDGLDVSGALEVDVAVGSAGQVTIDGDDNIVPLVRTEVSGRVLRLWTERGYSVRVPLIVHVVTPSLAAVDVSGAAHVRAQGIHGDKVSLTVGGAGELTAAGTAREIAVDLSGAGSVNSDALQAQRATVKVSGAGSVDLYASQALSALVSGAGHIRYDGHPPDVTKDVSGAGSIEPR